MIKRYFIITIITIVTCNTITIAQDPHFTQFYANLLYLNPAFAGSVKCPRLALSYRNQWPALGSNYVTYNVTYDQHVDALQGGIGLIAMNDVQGDGAINTLLVSGIYSYTLPVSRNFSLKGGFQASYMQKKLNWDYIFPDMIHPLYGPVLITREQTPGNLTKGFFDFSAGLVGFNKNYYFGFACHHLTEPIESYRNSSAAVLYRKYTLHFGSVIPLQGRNFRKGELSLSPNILFMQQKNYQQINYGLYLNRKSIVGGFWFRQNFQPHADAFIMLIGFNQEKIKFAYSYDLTVSKLKNEALGAHEITYAMTFNCKSKSKKFRSVSCPSF